MNYNEIIKVAWKSITSNKSRSILTMLGVIIGVAAVIVMMGVSAGTEASIAESIEGLGSNLTFIQSAMTRNRPGEQGGNDNGLVMDDVTAIQEQVNGVAGVAVDQSTSGTVKYDDTSLEDLSIVGTTADFLTVRDLNLGDGRFITEQDYDRTAKIVILGSTVAEELFGEEDPIGQSITAESVKLTVVGVLEEKGLVSGVNYDEQIYVPISLVFEKFMPSQFARMMGDSVRLIYVSVDEEYEMEDVMLQVELLLLNRHDLTADEANFTITTQDDIIETQESTTESFRMLLGWVAGVSLIVGGIGIMNIMLVSVTERTREIGLRQALGARPIDIQVQFLTEALMLSLVGGLLGVLFGVGGAWLFSELGGMRTVVVSYSVILSFSSAALVGIFFGYIPARKAAQLDPIVALRHD